MRANVLSSPTFRYAGGNFTDVVFDEVNPRPYSDIENEDSISDLKKIFEDKKLGISKEAVDLNKEKSNSRKVIKVENDIDLKTLKYELNAQNDVLLDDIKIQSEENTKSSFIIDYVSTDDVKIFRNSVLYVYAKENSIVDIYLVSRQNDKSKVYQSVAIATEKNACVNLYQVDMSVGEKLCSVHSYVMGDNSKFNINSAYFLEKEEFYDILYNVDIYGKLSETDVVVNGIQKDNSRKIFKGTLDFKRGAKASKGSQEEYVTLLDKNVKSKALPIILCEEENIIGNHASSAGQIDEQMLFYIMSRGFSMEEAKAMIVKARLVPVIDKIPYEKLREELLLELKNKMVK